MWHASVAIFGKERTLFMAEVSRTTRRFQIALGKRLLMGVGQFPSAVEEMTLAIHYRRALTDAEYAALPPMWCALPAVHEAGRGLLLEENT